MIAWLAILNRLPIVDRLRSQGMDMDGLCLLCKQEQESRDHLFFSCSFSKEIWKKVLLLCGLNREVLGWIEELAWAEQRLKGKALISHVLRVGWNAFIYHVWKERNSRVFKQKEQDGDQIMEHVKFAVRYRLARLRKIVFNEVNMSLSNTWGLFYTIFG